MFREKVTRGALDAVDELNFYFSAGRSYGSESADSVGATKKKVDTWGFSRMQLSFTDVANGDPADPVYQVMQVRNG